MTIMNCIVIDDEYHAVEVMEAFIAQTAWLNLLASTTDPVRGIALIREHQPDVLFLDIQMDKLTGLDIRELIDKEIFTVFCTASTEHAVRSYELSVIDYLLKPISFKRFTQTAERIYQLYLSRPPQWVPDAYIVVKVDHKGKLVKINLAEIDFIEAKRNYVVFTTAAKSQCRSAASAKSKASCLPRISRGCINLILYRSRRSCPWNTVFSS